MLARKILETTHPDHDRELIADYRALYAGGKAFRLRIQRFLPKNDAEPEQLYELRKKTAKYRSYLGPIVNYFASYLLSAPFTPRAKKEEQPVKEIDPYYPAFRQDCDGAGTDLDAFMRQRTIDALTARRSWWRIDLPSNGGVEPQSKLDWEQRGLGKARLCDVPAESILDWSVSDKDQNLDYVITYEVTMPRTDPRRGRSTAHHEWRIYDRSAVEVYAVDVEAGKSPPDEIPLVLRTAHGFACVPFVCLDVRDDFWIANQIADAQKDHFSLSAGLGWSIRRTCYAMPVFKLKAALDGSASNPVMGAGYYLVIGADDDMDWAAPPTEHLAVIQQEIKDQKDEIYRVVHQMALGVDNNAAAIGRSGSSKLADAEAVKIILTALGEVVRGAIELTFDMLSSVRGDGFTWGIDGLDVYEDIDVGALTEAVTEALALDIPSPTFHREVKVRVANALVSSADQETKDKIRDEIVKNTSDEEVLSSASNKLDDGGGGDGTQGANGTANGSAGADARPGAKPAQAD